MGAPGRILVVEDDQDLLRIMTRVLTKAGYDVVEASGGEDALAKIQTEKFDLVLTDLAMPKVSGVTVIEAIRKNPDTRRTPILAVTAHWLDRISQSAEAVGCSGFIAKPFTTEELLYQVKTYLSLPPRP
jgi:CheY-like chemotaxis protein